MSGALGPGLDPISTSLLATAAGASQAAMPSRLPVPFGAALGGASAGLLAGQQQALQAAQQRQALQSNALNLRLQQAVLPSKIALLTGLGGLGENGQASAAGAPPPPGGGGSPPMPQMQAGFGGMASAPPDQGSAAQGAVRQLLMLRNIAFANGDGRSAAALQTQLDNIAGPGGVTLPDGSVAPVPGSAGNRFGTAAATASGTGSGSLPYDEAKQANQAALTQATARAQAGLDVGVNAAKAATDAGYQPPVTIDQTGPDGITRPYAVPRTSLPGLGQPGASGVIPASTFVQRIMATENATGNPGQPTAGGSSSAVGDGQFTQGTFQTMFSRAYPDLARSMSPSAIQALRGDPQVAQDMTARLAQANAQTLTGMGVRPTGATLGMAHILGAPLAAQVAQAPNLAAPMSSIMGSEAAAANPSIARQTIGQFRSNAILRYGSGPVAFGDTPASGPASLPGAVQAGPPKLSAEQAGPAGALADQQKAIIEAGSSAGLRAQQLDILENASKNFTTGALGPARVQVGKTIIGTLQNLGIKPSESLVNSVASGEAISKEGLQFTISQVKQLGSREAGMIVQLVNNNMPNQSSSAQGFQTITGALRQVTQHDQDLESFRQQYVQQKGTWAGGQTMFDRLHPPQAYASRVIPMALPTKQADATPNVVYQTPRGPMLWNGQVFQPPPPTDQ